MKKSQKTLIGVSANSNIPMLFTKSWTITNDGVVYHFTDVYDTYNADYIYGINPPFRGIFMVYFHARSSESNKPVYLDNIYGSRRQLYRRKKTNSGVWSTYTTDDITDGYYLMTYDPEKQMLFIIE